MIFPVSSGPSGINPDQTAFGRGFRVHASVGSAVFSFGGILNRFLPILLGYNYCCFFGKRN